jgi:hypothetical protein
MQPLWGYPRGARIPIHLEILIELKFAHGNQFCISTYFGEWIAIFPTHFCGFWSWAHGARAHGDRAHGAGRRASRRMALGRMALGRGIA